MNRITVVIFGLCCSVLCSYAASADEPSVKLKEVVVTATKTEKDPQDVTQSVTVITADDIKKSGAMTAEQAIKRTVGVQLQDIGPRGSVADISLRGSTSAEVLVLVDGRRMNSAGLGSFDFSTLAVPLEDIDRIEILRGPASALYGADAMGGVINIITKKPIGPESTITSAGGSHGYWTLGAGNADKIGNYYYSVSVNKERSDGYRINSDLDKTTTGAKLGYEFSKDSSVEATVNYVEKAIGVPGSTQIPSPFASEWDRNINTSLTYKARFSTDTDLRVSAYDNRNKDIFNDPDPLYSQYSRNISTSNGAELQINRIMASWNVLTLGVDARADHIESGGTGGAGEHSASLMAGYIQDEISIGQPFILVLGGRYDDHSVFGGEFDPKASARYLIASTGTTFRASIGRAFRAPTLEELYWANDGYEQGNSHLKPETSVEYEGGVEQSLGKGSSIKFTLFERHAKNLIVWMPDPNNGFIWTPTNFGSARISGCEAEAKTTFFDMLIWGVNYTYMNTMGDTLNASNQVVGERIIGDPAEQFKSYLNLTVPKSKTNVYIEGRYVRNYWIQSLDTPFSSNPSRHYGVADVKISQPMTFGSSFKTDVFVAVNNITNRSYEVSGGYPMPPTEVFGGLSIKF